MNDDCIDPLLQRRATAVQPTSEIVTRAGRKNRECCGRIDRSWEDVEIVLEFEEAFSRFAERAVTSNDDNSLGAGSQRRARLDRRVAARFRFVYLIVNAGGVELLFDMRPNTPRFSRGVIDYDESLDGLAYPRTRARLAASANSRARGIASTAREICGSASLKTCVAMR